MATPQKSPLPTHPERRLSTEAFTLAWFKNASGKQADTLHIYIDGDGSPLSADGSSPSDDPTPLNPLALKLAAIDPHEAVYIGRPCHWLVSQPACNPSLWTGGRYSAEVVSALCQGARLIMGEVRRDVSLIGFSGGGALAVLLAHCLETTVNVVTINGNLSIDTWSRSRGFLPLTVSENPIDYGLPDRVSGRAYFVGLKDSVVPGSVSSTFAARHGGEVIAFYGYGHSCCWQRDWPSILQQLARRFDRW